MNKDKEIEETLDRMLDKAHLEALHESALYYRGQRDYLFGIMMMIRDMPHEAKRFASGAIESIRRQEEP